MEETFVRIKTLFDSTSSRYPDFILQRVATASTVDDSNYTVCYYEVLTTSFQSASEINLLVLFFSANRS